MVDKPICTSVSAKRRTTKDIEMATLEMAHKRQLKVHVSAFAHQKGNVYACGPCEHLFARTLILLSLKEPTKKHHVGGSKRHTHI